MGGKNKSYRDRYFENYQAVKVPANNRRGYKVEYHYTGLWAQWERERGSLKDTKRRILLFELLSLALYLPAALSGTPLSVARLFNGFGTLSLVPWLMEFAGVIRFLASGDYVKEPSVGEISMSIRNGSVIRFILTVLSAAAGGIQILSQHKAILADLPVFLAVMGSAVISLLVKREYDRLLLITYRNDGGKPGERF